MLNRISKVVRKPSQRSSGKTMETLKEEKRLQGEEGQHSHGEEDLSWQGEEELSWLGEERGVNDDPQDLTNRPRLHKHELVIARQDKEDELMYIKSKLSHHRLVFHILNETYLGTTGRCPCCRYFDMKLCVDKCIENFHDEGFVSRYFSGGDIRMAEMMDIDGVFDTIRRMTIATNSNNMLKMNEKELVSNIMWMEEELNKLQRQVITEERKLQKLTSRYTKLPELNVFKRYTALHDMIEEACMDCMTDVKGQVEPRGHSRGETR